MTDTHINAFEMDVQEKLQAVQDAQAEYQAAVDRLQAKKHELGLDTPAEDVPEPAKSAPQAKPKLGLGKK